MNNSQKKIIRDLHSNSRELHDSRREKAQFSLTQLYLSKSKRATRDIGFQGFSPWKIDILQL